MLNRAVDSVGSGEVVDALDDETVDVHSRRGEDVTADFDLAGQRKDEQGADAR